MLKNTYIIALGFPLFYIGLMTALLCNIFCSALAAVLQLVYTLCYDKCKALRYAQNAETLRSKIQHRDFMLKHHAQYI